jgi:hypothetical protein
MRSQADDMVRAAVGCGLGRIIVASIVDHKDFDLIDAGEPLRQSLQRFG